MSDNRLIILVLGVVIVLSTVGALALSFSGKHDAAVYTGLVTAICALLCPSPIFNLPPSPPKSVSETTVATVVQSETTSDL